MCLIIDAYRLPLEKIGMDIRRKEGRKESLKKHLETKGEYLGSKGECQEEHNKRPKWVV